MNNPIVAELHRRKADADRQISALEAERAELWTKLAAMCEGNPKLTKEVVDHLCSQNSVDISLRYLYDTLRNKKITMAIEFKHNGRTWRADTPEEAISLRRKLEEADDFTVWLDNPVDALPDGTWTHDAVMELLQALGPQQHSFLRVLLEKGPLPSDQVRRALNLESEVALAGVISGLSKQAKKAGAAPSALYSVTVSWTGKDKTRTFELSKPFGLAAKELGWPDAWEQK